MTVADVLAIYGEEHAPHVADPARIGYAIDALLPFWGELPVSAIRAETCRRYAADRKLPVYAQRRGKSKRRTVIGYKPASPGTVRKELATLQTALNYCQKNGYLLGAPIVTLPPRPETPQRSLTRSEAAKLIRAARSHGAHHVARFILIGLYTGTRRDAILNLRLSGPSAVGGWFDLDKGLLYRRGEAERDSKKRRTPARVPRQLLAHARRWHARGLTWAVEWRGQRVGSIKTAWGKAVAAARLGWSPTPHTLKHTAITWAIEAGVSITDAAGFFGTSAETIERVYWHKSPMFQQAALDAMERRRK